MQNLDSEAETNLLRTSTILLLTSLLPVLFSFSLFLGHKITVNRVRFVTGKVFGRTRTAIFQLIVSRWSQKNNRLSKLRGSGDGPSHVQDLFLFTGLPYVSIMLTYSYLFLSSSRRRARKNRRVIFPNHHFLILEFRRQ